MLLGMAFATEPFDLKRLGIIRVVTLGLRFAAFLAWAFEYFPSLHSVPEFLLGVVLVPITRSPALSLRCVR